MKIIKKIPGPLLVFLGAVCLSFVLKHVSVVVYVLCGICEFCCRLSVLLMFLCDAVVVDVFVAIVV